MCKLNFGRVASAAALFSMGLISNVWAQAAPEGHISYTPVIAGSPLAVPTLGGWVLMMTALILALVAFRVLRRRSGTRVLSIMFLAALVGLGGVAGKDLMAMVAAQVKQTEFDSPTGGVVVVTAGVTMVVNVTDVTQRVTRTEGVPDGEFRTPADPQLHPACTAGQEVEPGEACYAEYHPIENRVMWDVWFDSDVGMEAQLVTPLVLDLNNNDWPDITGANILGDGRVDDPILFDMDPRFISFEFKCEIDRGDPGLDNGKCHPEAVDGYWVDADGNRVAQGPPDGEQRPFSGYEYLDEDGHLLGQMKDDGLYHYGEQEERELTEWLKPGGGDGFLVWDYEGDGQITSARELFGTVGLAGEAFANGFEKLAHYFDADGDGYVDGDELDGLQVWVDANGDGIVDSGELQSLEDHGIIGFDVGGYDRDTMEGTYQIEASD